MHENLDAFEPFHGVLLCEGEDISPEFRQTAERETSAATHVEANGLFDSSSADQDAIRTAAAAKHPSDAALDSEKDKIEFELVRRCMARGIPLLGICRGSQIINVQAGGTIYEDIEFEVPNAGVHIDYANYDGHRHPVTVEPHTPLHSWFDRSNTLDVSSYHHQGIKKLAERFSVMATSPDGLVEAFYDPLEYFPAGGRFLCGLQFHPERMQRPRVDGSGRAPRVFDYPGCPRPYEAFVLAARSFAAKDGSSRKNMASCNLKSGRSLNSIPVDSLDVLRRLHASGVTVRGGQAYLQRIRKAADTEPGSKAALRVARAAVFAEEDSQNRQRILDDLQRMVDDLTTELRISSD